ncbi:carbon-nitrogen family hydrolase [Liquorilactobacillus capillatus]|nr:carbon-nitrogen family hydrolase [Liquorilactobacillus capillatus]
MSLKVSLIQMDVKYGKPDVNYRKVAELVAAAMTEHPDVLILPEMWNIGYALEQLEELADQNGEHTQSFLAALARKYQVNIIGGSVATSKNNFYYNTSYVFDREGKLQSEYDKVHLFGLMHEDQWVTAGTRRNCFKLDNIPAAGVICYDIRFPEWERTLMGEGAKILFVSAQWPRERIKQWQLLLQARAIENQVFVVAVNRVGKSPSGDVFNGHSLVIDPLGNIISNIPVAKEGAFTTKLDLTMLEKIRGEIPVFTDRRPELYD